MVLPSTQDVKNERITFCGQAYGEESRYVSTPMVDALPKRLSAYALA
jgi:hypothetical protein